VANPYPTGTCTLQDAPSFAWRANAKANGRIEVESPEERKITGSIVDLKYSLVAFCIGGTALYLTVAQPNIKKQQIIDNKIFLLILIFLKFCFLFLIFQYYYWLNLFK